MSAKFPRGGGAGPFLALSLVCRRLGNNMDIGQILKRDRGIMLCKFKVL